MQYKLEQPIEASIDTGKYQCVVKWSNGSFVADEPEKMGGKAMGPDPYTLLLSSLATCTLVTLRMYIDRKGWDIPTISVQTNIYEEIVDGSKRTTIDRDIHLPTGISTEMKEKLLEIAKACPISKILESPSNIRTYMYHEEEVEKKILYKEGDVTVVWKPDLCKHSGRCVKGLPGVFNVQARPWVNMQGASGEEIMRQVEKCPTGALSLK
jgi:putative redox protein